MVVDRKEPLPVVRVGQIPREENASRWLVEQLWGDSSVGVIGGAPKCSKTWLGLDLALSVATGTPCLGRYAVPRPGPVLVYLAEDALPVVRERVRRHGPASRARPGGRGHPRDHRGVVAAGPGTPPKSASGNRPAAAAPVAAAGSAGTAARRGRKSRRRSGRTVGLLPLPAATARPLGRFWCITPGKTPPGEPPPARDSRGSSDIHAFGDSNLYLRRVRERLVLLSEHRAAPASPAVSLELVTTDAATIHLEVVAEPQGDRPGNLQQQVLACLVPGQALTRAKLRDVLSVQNQRLGEALETLERAGKIRRSPAGWQRVG